MAAVVVLVVLVVLVVRCRASSSDFALGGRVGVCRDGHGSILVEMAE